MSGCRAPATRAPREEAKRGRTERTSTSNATGCAPARDWAPGCSAACFWAYCHIRRRDLEPVWRKWAARSENSHPASESAPTSYRETPRASRPGRIAICSKTPIGLTTPRPNSAAPAPKYTLRATHVALDDHAPQGAGDFPGTYFGSGRGPGRVCRKAYDCCCIPRISSVRNR